jgi:hypothetical protein
MSDNAEHVRDIPGLEMVGRGIYIRPRETFELKRVLFSRGQYRIYPSWETGQDYRVPEGYEVNDSPPMPASQALSRMMIEESWERFEKETSLDVAAAAGNAPFSVDVNASQMGQVRSQEDSYYALRTSFIPLWSLYIPVGGGAAAEEFDFEVPTPFDPDRRRDYDRFFECYGTHYIKRAWVGGKAMLAFTIAKSSAMSREEIKAGIQASQVGLGSVSTNLGQQRAKEKLSSNSECTVFGKGGDELKLATLSSLDESRYNEWVSSIKGNPQLIEFDACGIWTLVDDEAKANALRDAYIRETVFTPIRAVLNLDGRVHVFRGDTCFSYNPDTADATPPVPVKEAWPMLGKVGFEQIDAAFLGKYLTASTGEDLSRKLFFFNRDQYIRFDVDAKRIDDGYPRLIAEGWPGTNFQRIDAALNVSGKAVYFFLGKQYVRFDVQKHRVDDGYPQVISKRWAGVNFDRVDAAVYWGSGKVYFFRDNQHIRYDTVNFCSDPGYPKFIFSNYIEDWRFFD